MVHQLFTTRGELNRWNEEIMQSEVAGNLPFNQSSNSAARRLMDARYIAARLACSCKIEIEENKSREASKCYAFSNVKLR